MSGTGKKNREKNASKGLSDRLAHMSSLTGLIVSYVLA